VQSQILASTTALNSTVLQNFTNGLGFVGLTLDIIGTSLGVVHAIYLQNAIRSYQQLLQYLSVEPLKKKIRHLQTTKTSREETMELIKGHQEKIEFLPSLPPARSQVFLGHNVAPRYLSDLPLVAMSLGIACLLASAVCFAASSEPRAVWITCTAITAASAVYLVMIMARNITSEFLSCSPACSVSGEFHLPRCKRTQSIPPVW
jgi:hypothetical protein